jgi:hypothetical protein
LPGDSPSPASASHKPEKGFAWAAAIWTAIGAGFAFRALYHPHRAVVDRGFVGSCPGGSTCAPSLGVQPEGGSTTVYALTSGTVVVTRQGLTLVSDREPAVVSYGAAIGELLVASGSAVGIGTPLAVMRAVSLTVTEIVRDASGAVSFRPLEPAAWLASRGLSVSAHGNPKGTLWCTQGRSIVLPQTVTRCGLRLPAPSAALLLPVSVTME